MASQIPTMPCGEFIYIVLQKKANLLSFRFANISPHLSPQLTKLTTKIILVLIVLCLCVCLFVSFFFVPAQLSGRSYPCLI